MNLFGLVLTIVVLLGIAVFVLLFERRRALQIQRDLHEAALRRRDPRSAEEGPWTR